MNSCGNLRAKNTRENSKKSNLMPKHSMQRIIFNANFSRNLVLLRNFVNILKRNSNMDEKHLDLKCNQPNIKEKQLVFNTHDHKNHIINAFMPGKCVRKFGTIPKIDFNEDELSENFRNIGKFSRHIQTTQRKIIIDAFRDFPSKIINEFQANSGTCCACIKLPNKFN